jgi:hypothetical protein
MRYLLFAIGVASVFFAPLWGVALVALLLSLRWRAWEVLFLGVLVDILWFPSGFAFGIPLATVLSVVLVWLFEPLRAQLLLGPARA